MDEDMRVAFETLLAAIHAMHSAVVARLDAMVRLLDKGGEDDDEGS